MMGGTGGAHGHHHNRNHASNQSANYVARGMTGINLLNYSILQSELEQETGSLEDMHMFFVAFNQRQNKMLGALEKTEIALQANDRKNLLYIDDEPNDSPLPVGRKRKDGADKERMNIIMLRNEVDLE
jgi:hypothetical protein